MTQELLHLMQNKEFRKAFGRRVKELRKQKKWTQKDLARRLDVRFQQLNKYECGLHIPPAEKLVLLAKLLDTTLDYLLSGQEPDGVSLHNQRLLERFRALQGLGGDEQEVVIKLIDAVIVKNRVEGALAPIDRRAS